MRVPTLLLVALVAASSGCVANMGELKELLGAAEPVQPAALVMPPVAKAQANATSVLLHVPVRFSAEGSHDPQGLPLRFEWRFGTEVVDGVETVRAFNASGEHRVQLAVTNAGGVTDTQSLVIQVVSGNRPPTAQVTLTDEAGLAPAGVRTGQALLFDAGATRDPDGDALAYDWDFGDGRTSHEPRATHAFEKWGRHEVKLTVSDGAGDADHWSTTIPVSGGTSFDGAFEPAGSDSSPHSIAVPQGIQRLDLALRFPGGLGLHDLEVVVRDAAGKEVGRSGASTPPASQATETRTLRLEGDSLRNATPGTWTLEVLRESGVSVTYSLGAELAY